MRLFWFLLVLVLCVGVASAEISVVKQIMEEELVVGGTATVDLNLSNPFNTAVGVVIVDNNVLGGNGLDIQCLEHSVPPGISILRYDPVALFKEGKFTLEKAVLQYINPETGDNETIESETLKVKVDEGNSTGMTQQGITTIYQCQGQNMKSTSYSSSQQQPQQQQTQQQKEDQRQDMQNKMANNQMNQDTSALKEQMKREIDEDNKKKEEIAKKLQEDQELAKKHKELTEQGFKQSGGDIDAETNDTGEFELDYQREDGESASISGKIENGTVTELSKKTSLDDKNRMEQLKQNEEFKEFDKELASMGFNKTGQEFTETGGNMSEVRVDYMNAEGEQANITAEFAGDNVTDVEMEKPEFSKDRNEFWLLGVLILLGIAGYLLYLKHWKNAENADPAPEKKVDYHAEAKKMLKEAGRLFDKGEFKDAYGRAGEAIRFFVSYKNKDYSELTNTETIRLMGKSKELADVKTCLGLCGLVEFAKYKANKKDFSEILELGGRIIR